MTRLYQHDFFLKHKTGAHPECAARLEAIHAKLEESGLADRCNQGDWSPATLEEIGRVHSLEYARQVELAAEQGGSQLDPDTVVSPDSYEVARFAAGAVCDAVRRVVTGEEKNALCLVRPPGHHAVENQAMGFCLFNNIAVGARLATQELQVDRVLIVDWDVHHGNGSQDTFYTDPQVGFLSIHRWPFYPGTGSREERGSGDGAGTILNLPIEFGTPREEYFDRFSQGLDEIARRMKPQLVLISAGFDAHRYDPVGNLGLETEDYGRLTQLVLDVANTYAEGKVVSTLEGGYDVDALADSAALHLETLLQAAA